MCEVNNVEIPAEIRNNTKAKGNEDVFLGLMIRPDKNKADRIVQTVYKKVILGNSYNSLVSREKTKGSAKMRRE